MPGSSMIDRDAVKPGDTITWKTNASRMTAWGVVQWTDSNGVHVIVRGPIVSPKYTITWDRVLSHSEGRAEYDRHA